jgi:hypothetical protein
MQVQTPKQIIEILSKYQPDELLMVTWWSQEDVEMLVADEDVETEKAKEVWNDIVYDLDHRTSDHVISHVNDEMDSMVYEKLEQNK